MSALPFTPVTPERPEAAALRLAKRRALGRRSSSGGTMFVVAMTLAVLSTIGAWALQSAALEVRMAGFERQSSQTHYLAEYGLMATMQDVSPTTAPPIVKWAMCGAGVSSAGGTTNYHAACLSLPCLVFPTAGGAVTVNAACTEVAAASPVAKACYRWEGWSSFGAGFPVPDTSVPLMDVEDGGVSGIPGSLGATNTAGTFSAEITEIAQAPAASGFSLGNTTTNSGTMTSYWATVTAYGQTSASSNGTTSSTSQGSELLRARVAIGPIPTVVLGNCQ